MAAAEATAHMTAAAEPATVSTSATMSTAAATATRKRAGGQSPGESGSHSQNNHAFA
jgi:hypothetical protein